MMVEQQIAFVKRDLPRIPLRPVPVLHGFLSVEAGPLLALTTRLQSLAFQVGEPKQRSCIDETGLQHSFHGLDAKHENTVDFDHLYAAAVCASELAEKFGVVYDGFSIDVSALRPDA